MLRTPTSSRRGGSGASTSVIKVANLQRERGYDSPSGQAGHGPSSKKNRSISRLAFGPRGSVYEPTWLPPDHA